MTHVCHWNDTTGTRFMQSMSLDHSPGCFVPGYFRATLREDALHSFGGSAAGPSGSTRRGNAAHGPCSAVDHRRLTSQGDCGLFDFSGSWSMVPKRHLSSCTWPLGRMWGPELRFCPVKQENANASQLEATKSNHLWVHHWWRGYNILPQVISLRERWRSLAFTGVVKKNRNSSFVFTFHLLFVSSDIKVDFFTQQIEWVHFMSTSQSAHCI